MPNNPETLKRYAETHKEQIKQSAKRYRDTHKDQIKAYIENRKEKKNAYAREYYKIHRQEKMDYQRKIYKRTKEKFIEMYGGKCACCEEAIFDFLTIEHKNGQRRIIKETGTRAYRKAIKEYRPDLYEILCWNCNCAKGQLGYCPHHPEDKPQSHIIHNSDRTYRYTKTHDSLGRKYRENY